MPTKHHPADRYPAVCCRFCGAEMREVVTIVVVQPLGFDNWTKLGLRSKKVEIVGYDPTPRTILCDCPKDGPTRKDRKRRGHDLLQDVPLPDGVLPSKRRAR